MRIAGVGAYAPRFRLSAEAVENALGRFRASGVRRVAVPDADEDALTMAAEAAERALAAAGYETEQLDTLFLASTTLPYDEETATGRLGSILGVPETTRVSQFAGSTNAGGEALAAALDSDGASLVVAADCPTGAPDEAFGHAAGAGAAAVLVAPDGPGRVVDRASYTDAFPGTRFRERGEDETTGLGVTTYDREAYQETLTGAVEAAGGAEGVDAAALQAPDGDLPYRVAGALELDSETIQAGAVAADIGDAGAASALLGFASALAEGHEDVLLATYGSGAAARAFRVRADERLPTRITLEGDRDLDFAAAERRRGTFDSGAPEGGGAYVSVPSFRRTLPQRHRLVAGRCRTCGSLAFPPAGACTNCGSREDYEPVELSGTGRIEAVTEISQGGAPPEFVPQQARAGAYASAIVAFEGPEGGSVSAPVQVVLDGDDVPAIGDEVVSRVRFLYEQEGVRRYGVKVVPIDQRRP
jgi:hydroxymethylglutaryl-CoA synthase